MTDNKLTVEALEEKILQEVSPHEASYRRIAEALQPFINRHIADRVAEAGKVSKPAGAMINGLTEAETAATASVMGLAKPAGDFATSRAEGMEPAGAVPLPQRYSMPGDHVDGRWCRYEDAIRYGDAREAAGRADTALTDAVQNLVIFTRESLKASEDAVESRLAEPAGSEVVAYTVTHVQGCTVVGYFLLEVETDNPPKTGDILYARRLTGSKSDA